LAHLTAHAAVKGQLEQDPLVRAAFEKMLATGTAAHHAEHVLGALLFETEWETARAVEAGKDSERPRGVYIRKLQKLIRDSAFRKKLTRQSRPIILRLNRGDSPPQIPKSTFPVSAFGRQSRLIWLILHQGVRYEERGRWAMAPMA
jgi:hypothetical protein